jgi:transmembrane sensor
MTAERDNGPMDEAARLKQEAYEWVVRFVSGEAGPAELAALKEWSARSPAHAEAFDRARKVWNAFDPARRQQLVERVSGVHVSAARAASAPGRSRLGRRAFIGGALAASAAGAAVMVARPPLDLWPSLSELTADYRTKTGEQRQVVLANNVSVELNTQTSIALRPSGDSADRIELVWGEAMISAPDSSMPFTVLAADGRIMASKARFNVRYIGPSVCVTCLEGDVHVEQRTVATQLSAGRQVIYSDRGIEAPVAIDRTVVTAWKDGIVIFDGTPVSDVVVEINRYRQGKVILTNAALGRERFNARFRIENIDRVIVQVAQIFGARTRTLPGGITLLG